MDIKIFVCCHQPGAVPQHPLLVPLQVGAALADTHFPGFLHDDAGDNISAKNRSYCELTGQYWAWKNVKADYYGFFHYRRYLYPRMEAKSPYQIKKKPTLWLLDGMGYGRFEDIITQFDMILPKGEDMHIPVRKHYGGAAFHHREDLEQVEQIVQELFPEYALAMEEYLSGTLHYFGNLFIMRRQAFQSYCNWLFPILEEFDRRADMGKYGWQERRVDGYLAERLLGIYAVKHRELRKLELPKVHFVENAGDRMKMRAVNLFLPPGSVRRSRIKAIMG